MGNIHKFLKKAVIVLVAGLLMVAPVRAVSAEQAVLESACSDIKEQSWGLRLVNPWNALPEDYDVKLTVLKNGLKVDARIYDDLNAMLTDCRAHGLQPIVCSAYRDYQTQNRLYRNKIARLRAAGYSLVGAETEAARWVAVPGTSEHQTGLALDLVSYSYQLLDEKQEQTAEQQWLMEHSWEYGFVLRYPKDKSEVTGIGYEPWHYRYVGKEAAAAMHAHGWCLEEYLKEMTALEETANAVSSFLPKSYLTTRKKLLIL